MIKKNFRHFFVAVCAVTIFSSCGTNQAIQNTSAYHAQPTYCGSHGKATNPTPRHKRFGFFTPRLWRDYESSLSEEISRFGVTPGYSLWYMGLDRDFPLNVAQINKKQRVNLVISHDIRHGQFDPQQNQNLLTEIVEGKWDEYFRQFARDARRIRKKVYYRFGYEMNGGWFPWGRKPESFKAAWRHVHTLFREEKADNVLWVFSPNVLWGERTFDEHIHIYYPGGAYVDIVGLDGYNFGDNFDHYHRWRSFEDLFEQSLEGMATYGKPIWIAEVGCVADQRRAQWVNGMLDWLDKNPCVTAFFWFDDHKQGEPDFSLAGEPETLPILQSWLGADEPKIPLISSIVALFKSLPVF